MANPLRTAAYWLAVGERAVKTFAQAELALLTGDGLGLADVNWQSNLSIAGMACLYSVVTSLASIQIGNSGPSLSTETVLPVSPAAAGQQ